VGKHKSGVGYIRLRNENGGILKTFEPDFGGGFEYSFSTTFPVFSDDLEFITSIKVYPNPAGSFCSLEADDLTEANVYLLDFLGRTISKSLLHRAENLISFDLQDLNSRVYFIVINKGEITTTRKLIIK